MDCSRDSMSEPVLTRAEKEVAEYLAKGWGYGRIAQWLGIKKGTVYVLCGRIAEKLSKAGLNPDKLKPYQLVYGWARDHYKRQGVA